MNIRSIESQILFANAYNDKETIGKYYIELSNEKAKMDRWFDKFLDKFSDKLSSCDRSDPVKKMYNTKYDRYSQLSRVITIAEKYMKA